MRLLKLIGPGQFSLIEVATNNTPPYAILSHTWTDGQEVSFKDLTDGGGEDRLGFKKIMFCCEQASKDDLQFFWVDTCCIDKSNNTELTEAINSMFRWYQNAARCYVYLSDISIPGRNADPKSSQTLWEASFRRSRWFTRGWTLQELIAPEVVDFFSSEGIRLGDKRSLQKQIHEISGIPIQALQGNPFSHFSVAERIAWATKRHTTKEEDEAYCLLGICEVSMPLIYGEGKAKALNRLLREVNESSKETGNFKEQEVVNKAPFLVPFERNSRFTGREAQLTKLEGDLFNGEHTTRIAIAGLGGTGKTQVALELAYRTKWKYQNCSVLWIPTIDAESLHQAYLDIAKHLNISGWDDEKADVRRLLQTHLSSESAGQWLLIFDNADDINIWIATGESDQGSGRLIDYLPKSKRGCIVFTTRNRKVAVKLANQHVLELAEMDPIGATQLLRNCLLKPDLANDQEIMEALLEQLTHLPLAIVQATAYINENGISLIDYLSLLAEQEEEVIDLLSEEFEDEGRYRIMKNPVATTWNISFDQIRQSNALAADYLSFMACIDRMGVPESLLPAGPSRKKEVDAIGILDAYSFIIRRPANMAFDLHRLVHLATRNWLRKEELLTEWSGKAITQMESVFPDMTDYRKRSVWRMYLPHARYILESDLPDKSEETRIALAWKVGMCLYHDGRFNESETFIREVTEFRERVLGGEDAQTLTSMHNLALVLVGQGKYDESEPIIRQTLKLRKKVLGQEHPDTLVSLNNLAIVLKEQGKYNEAESLYRETITLTKKVLGPEHHNTLASFNNFLVLLKFQGKYDEAEPLYRQTLELTEKSLGHEHPDTLISMNNLASLLKVQEKYDEAEPIYQRTLQLKEKILGQDHPSTLVSMNNLGSLLDSQGNYSDAEPLYRRTLQLREKTLGREHPETLHSIFNLASLLRKQGNINEAKDLFEEELSRSEVVYGLHHSETVLSRRNMAMLNGKL